MGDRKENIRKWSWKLGEIAGVSVYVHATFLFLVAWLLMVYWMQGQGLLAAFAGVTFILALFGCVLLHELGHALAARRYGVTTRDIILLPIGGVARLEKMPEHPRQEMLIALAGPAVNGAIFAVLFAVLQLASALEPLSTLSVTAGPFMERLMVANLFLAAFNMLPAFPMDGGRILRAALASRMEFSQATGIAARVGQGMAVLFGVAGLFANPFLLLIALVVWTGATQEANAVLAKRAVAGIPVSAVMSTDFHTLSPRDSLHHALGLTLRSAQKDLPVVDNGFPVCLLTRADLKMGGVSEAGVQGAVSKFMRPVIDAVDASETLETGYPQLLASDSETLLVTQDGRLVGLVTMENLATHLMLRMALGSTRQPIDRVSGPAASAELGQSVLADPRGGKETHLG